MKTYKTLPIIALILPIGCGTSAPSGGSPDSSEVTDTGDFPATEELPGIARENDGNNYPAATKSHGEQFEMSKRILDGHSFTTPETGPYLDDYDAKPATRRQLCESKTAMHRCTNSEGLPGLEGYLCFWHPDELNESGVRGVCSCNWQSCY